MRRLLFIFSTLSKIADFLINTLSIICGYLILRLFLYDFDVFEADPDVGLIVVLISAFSIFVYFLADFYKPTLSESSSQRFTRIVLSNVIIFVLLLLVIFPFTQYRLYYLVWLAFSVILSSAGLMLRWKISTRLRNFLKRADIGLTRVLIVTDDPALTRYYLREIRAHREYGYSFIGYVGDCRVGREDRLGPTADLGQILDETKPDQVVFAVSSFSKNALLHLVNLAEDRCIKTYLLPHYCSYFRSPRQVVEIGSMPLIDIRYTPADNIAGRLVKRLFDFFVSLILLIVLSPFLAAVAIGVKISSPGPVFFCQERVGKNGKIFKMYKFRSMKLNDTEETEWCSDADPRKTRFGNFIRRYAIDELPQLFNVLRGDMSLVGPRPERPYFVDYFRKSVPMYMLKHQVLPGMTGLSQILGLRGDTSIEERIQKDLEYIENWSILSDLKILFLTPFRIRNRHEVYEQNEQKHAAEAEAEDNHE